MKPVLIGVLGILIMASGLLFLPGDPGPAVSDPPPPMFVSNPKPALAELDPIVVKCEAAKDAFQPITEKEAAWAKQKLRETLERLNRKLQQDGPNGRAWRDYLLLDTLEKQLDAEGKTELPVLDRVYARFAGNQPGLRLTAFADTRRALRCYLETARAVGDRHIENEYQAQLDRLIEHLRAYAVTSSTDNAYRISQAVAWLQRAHQAPAVVEAVHKRFGHPNLHLRVSADLVRADIQRPVEKTGPVRDVILETNISGTSHTTGQLTADLMPDEDRGVIEILLDATSHSTTVGRNGPAIINSASVTAITARKRIWLDASGFGSAPAVTEATTDTTTTGIGSTRGSQLVQRVASRRVQEKKYVYQHISSAHTEARVNRQLDAEVDRHLAEANEVFQEKLRRPLLCRGLYPDPLTFHTTSETLRLTAMQARADQLGSPTTAPKEADDADLMIRVHETMVNNLADAALSGVTLHEDALRESVHKMLGFVPGPLAPREGKPTWALTFAKARPIVVTFHEDAFRVTLRGQRFFRGDETHPGMNISAAYRLEARDGCLKAVRQGDLEILPPHFMPGQERKLSVREKVLCDLLDIRFSRILPETFEGRGFTPKGRMREIGKLVPVRAESRDGWLVVAWKRARADTVLTALP